MFSKNYLFVLAAFVAGTMVLSTSCQKSDDVSTSSAMPDKQMTASAANTYNVVSHDGHFIGINGQTTSENPKYSSNDFTGCGAASNLAVKAVSGIQLSSGKIGDVLSNIWTSGGGACIALYINGTPYADPTTGFTLWTAAVNGILAEAPALQGGINSGQQFNVFVRTYCSTDTTGSTFYDSAVSSYVCPGGFPSETLQNANHGKGGKKK